MDTVREITLIETTLTRRGTGESKASPVRCIKQFWDKDGNKIAELDPCSRTLTPESIADIRGKLLEIMQETRADQLIAIIESSI